jgi:hypothetical protein
LILFEGEYSKILTPDVHFIPLKKDFSNIENVFDKIRDRAFIREMAERSYEDILRSGAYSYQAFISSFDKNLGDYMGSSAGQHAIPATDLTGSRTYIRMFNITAKLFMFLCRKFGRILTYLYRILHRLFHLLKQLIQFHPFFLSEKLKLMLKTIRQA